MVRNAIARIVAYVLYVVDFLLPFIPGTKANRLKRALALFDARVAKLEASVQKRYPGAKVEHLSAFGPKRNGKRAMRGAYATLWARAFNGWRLSGRQYSRLRNAQARGGAVLGRAAHVNYFLNGGDVAPPKARRAA